MIPMSRAFTWMVIRSSWLGWAMEIGLRIAGVRIIDGMQYLAALHRFLLEDGQQSWHIWTTLVFGTLEQKTLTDGT
nr:hypothetical protein Iba_chr11dCG8960 [Ipomoea batatas]